MTRKITRGHYFPAFSWKNDRQNARSIHLF